MPIIDDDLISDSNPASYCVDEDDIGWRFFKQSQFIPEWSNEAVRKIAHFNSTPHLSERPRMHVKSYPDAERLILSRQTKVPADSFSEVLSRRESQRDFSGEPATIDQLTNILRLSYFESESSQMHRTVPSAGARFPLEVYVYSRRIDSLKEGLFHFNIRDFSLETVPGGRQFESLAGVFEYDYSTISKAACLIFITGIPGRTTEKYGARGWRFMFMEAGYLGQNVSLSSAAVRLGCYTLGGGFDFEIGKFLGLNSRQEIPLAVFAIGRLAFGAR